MAEQIKPKFVFESKALDRNTFSVVKFAGTEGLSSLYRFDITLISKQADLDLAEILQNPAEFTIKRSDGDIPFRGILSSFEQLQQAGEYVFYRAELVPKLWWSTLTQHNQIFLNKTAQDFLNDVLKDGGLKQGLNYDFKLQGAYPSWEYICQYGESHFSFVSRWLERDGMYYYFEQTDQGEKMVITDTHISHSVMSEGTSLIYSPPSNMDHIKREEVVKNFMLKQQPMPKKVLLKDYNYRKPSLEMMAEAIVSPNGFGEIYIYGEHFQTPGDGEKLAKVRAEEYLCREKVFHGVSTVPYIRTGYIFELKDHYRQDFNQRYLTIEVTHEGSQEAYLISGLGLHLAKDEDRLYYRNSFSCIPATTQFRPERKTEKPKFHGSMNAKIDASGSGQYAELDSQGRYKVVLPLDTSGRSGGKATAWLRMAQPYSGSDHGMHFPLHKDTEVLLTCIDGDPDRPIIQAAVPNPETPSQVTDSNQTQCLITTGGQNRIHMEDVTDSEGILIQTPKSDSWQRLGAPNAQATARDTKPDGIAMHTDGTVDITTQDYSLMVKGDETRTVKGSSEAHVYGSRFESFLGEKLHLSAGVFTSLKTAYSVYSAWKEYKFKQSVTKMRGDVQKLTGEVSTLTGNQTDIAESVTELTAAHTQLREDHSTLTGQHNALKGQTASLAGQTSKLAGSVEKVSGDVSKLAGAESELCGEVTKLTGMFTRSVGESVSMIGLKTQSIATKTTVSGEASHISGEVNTIAGLINQI
ncbi:MAG: type VI secretion system tip protein VgrG [Deltaproteobacteria bacterium HGW-Deltaproteobacteria-8]|jgi:type VI secretion system secreted protein VgrG|nr:MAG: type VI secretion system tip protein VgrG [Deltaproteobacteria bacterium HGW-Deltaproteobacteria-8]